MLYSKLNIFFKFLYYLFFFSFFPLFFAGIPKKNIYFCKKIICYENNSRISYVFNGGKRSSCPADIY